MGSFLADIGFATDILFIYVGYCVKMTNKRLLLIEDNADDELLTRRAIEKYSEFNYVDVATDGVEALEYLSIDSNQPSAERSNADHKPIPDLILLDLKMPRLNGHEFLKFLRESSPVTSNIPVVVLTTSSEEKDIATSYELGANSFLRKPVNFVDFGKAIEQLSRYWLELNVPCPCPAVAEKNTH